MAQLDGSGRDGYNSLGPDVTQSDVPVFHLKAIKASKGAVLALDAVSSAGVITTVYIWATTAGLLKISTTLPTDTESGTSVGSQS
jgi:hypothetical protein